MKNKGTLVRRKGDSRCMEKFGCFSHLIDDEDIEFMQHEFYKL